MEPKAFDELMKQVPAELERLLGDMVKAGLVQSFKPDAAQEFGIGLVEFTDEGLEFIRCVHAVSAVEPGASLPRLIGLDWLAQRRTGFSDPV